MSSTSSASSASNNLKFSRGPEFRRALNDRVDEHFESSGKTRRDQPAMVLKTAVILSWFVASYSVLVFAPVSIWVRVLAAISLGFAASGVGFSIMHDAGHGAYSKNKTINKVVFLTLDMLGGSSFMWNVKHNILHHTYANVEGHDDDIDMGLLGRLAPEQKRLFFHRFQHIYIWLLYGLLVLKWHFYDDFAMLVKGRIGNRKLPPMKRADWAVFVLGKLFFLGYAFAIPMLLFDPLGVIAFYLLASFVQGVTMGTIFQLAHCVEEAEFPNPNHDMKMDHDWATHQVITTVDFAPDNPVLNWYVGGLNFQIEHHLFPRICHVHYPDIAPIVRETCREYGLPYRVQPTLRDSIASHLRWLRRMGRNDGVEVFAG